MQWAIADATQRQAIPQKRKCANLLRSTLIPPAKASTDYSPCALLLRLLQTILPAPSWRLKCSKDTVQLWVGKVSFRRTGGAVTRTRCRIAQSFSMHSESAGGFISSSSSIRLWSLLMGRAACLGTGDSFLTLINTYRKLQRLVQYLLPLAPNLSLRP